MVVTSKENQEEESRKGRDDGRRQRGVKKDLSVWFVHEDYPFLPGTLTESGRRRKYKERYIKEQV